MRDDEFFTRNRIFPKNIEDTTIEQKGSNKLFEKTGSFDYFFGGNLEDLMDCVNYSINKELFRVILEHANDYKDLFEPCCMSGLLGCYIKSELENASYKGIDKNRYAAEKAQSRAHLNHLDPNIFVQMDKQDYNNKHEAIIGRFVANKDKYGLRELVDDNAVEFLSRTSDNVVLIARAFPGRTNSAFNDYKFSFNRHGYKNFDSISRDYHSAVLDSDLFVIKASKH